MRLNGQQVVPKMGTYYSICIFRYVYIFLIKFIENLLAQMYLLDFHEIKLCLIFDLFFMTCNRLKQDKHYTGFIVT